MKLEDLIDAILDQTTNNELVLSFKRSDTIGINIVIRDDLSDIGYVTGLPTHEALKEMQEQMESFVVEQS